MISICNHKEVVQTFMDLEKGHWPCTHVLMPVSLTFPVLRVISRAGTYPFRCIFSM